MKIKKSLLTGLAVLALFGAGVSVSVSSVNSVEANAAVHHKNSKKHKKARKSVKKHKKAKKAVKKHKKSKKRVAKKATKKSVKKPVAKKAKLHTIVINDGDTTSKVKYNKKISKSYDNVDIAEHNDHNENNDGGSKHDMALRKIIYYNLYGDRRYKTAITLQVLYQNENDDDQYLGEADETSLTNMDTEKLLPAWGAYYNDFASVVPANSSQFVNLTFYSSKHLSLDSFSTFVLNYEAEDYHFGTTIHY